MSQETGANNHQNEARSDYYEKLWGDKAAALLIGRTIKNVRYLTNEERKTLGWYSRSLVVILDDGTHIWPSADDEGNDAGALFTTDSNLMTIPVIP